MPDAPPPVPNDDPITGRSLSGPLFIGMFLLLVTLAWALYQEFFGLRPWKAYQHEFVQAYTRYLETLRPQQAAAEDAVRRTPEFQKLEKANADADSAIADQEKQIRSELQDLDARISVLREVFASARGEVSAIIYAAETASSESARQKLLKHADEVKQRPIVAELPVPDGTMEKVTYKYDELAAEYKRLNDRKADLTTELARLRQPVTDATAARDAYLKDHVPGLSAAQLDGLIAKMKTFEVGIKQIHVSDTDLVDRCESCHLGTREPLTLTAADMGGKEVFVSHPDRDLLRIHDPERFGCSPCHGGNGRAIDSVETAHGHYEHWLYPLYAPENVEAGCQQCHAHDMVLDHADTLTQGKELFRLKGCNGCHRFEGFDDQAERLDKVHQQIHQDLKQRADDLLEIERSNEAGDRAATNEEAQRLYARATNLRVSISNLDAELGQLRVHARSLLREEKTLGPNLKDIRAKLRRDWIPVWIQNPHAFRPTTKMPRFRLQDNEVHAIAAFLWQDALAVKIPSQPPGNAARGKELFESRGCMGCHSIGEGDKKVGGTFAANLSRVGEKVNYDYLVRWIHNPRERLLPYCPLEKRDITAADYAKHGLPFQFDLAHSTCPNDGEEMRVQQMTVMPILRLTWEESRDIASFLMTQHDQDPASYAKADYMESPDLAKEGKALVQHYGCAGCHEIAGLEGEAPIGTDLTTEGSKPIERLDFALLTQKAEREGWYNHKGFFEHKLADPAVFDQGKIKAPLDKLKMPKPNLTQGDITALTTFLLGSVEPGFGFPQSYLYNPTDQAKAIQDGWWIVTKYNCMGCHQIRIGQQSALMTLPQYQTPEGKDKLPPVLIGVGARLNPEFLARFLANPALSTTDENRNGVRSYLQVRMPTFNFSVNEIQTLVRFFAALSSQAEPYIPPKLEPLTPSEQMAARALFTSPAAPCLKCHATGEPAHDRNATAPNFLLAKERLKPAWVERWIVDPASIIPGTAMPSGLFRQEGDRWVFAGPVPPAARAYKGDQADLLVRYMFQITPQEQSQLLRRLAAHTPEGNRRLALSMIKSH